MKRNEKITQFSSRELSVEDRELARNAQCVVIMPKVFIMDIPFMFQNFLPLKLFQELGLNLDIFCYRFLNIFVEVDKSVVSQKTNDFLDFLSASIKTNYPELDKGEMFYQFLLVTKLIYTELRERNLYVSGRLVFNNLNFETPNSMVFFRMDEQDV